MRILGWTLGRESGEAAVTATASSEATSTEVAVVEKRTLSPIARRPWWGTITEALAGNWQRNIEVKTDEVLANPTIYSCITLIASDIAKLRVKLVAQDTHGLWQETESSAFSPVLRKPNRFQTRIQFFQQWLISKLAWGNAYVLKQRDARGVVVALYVLDPSRVTPLVTETGDIYYDLNRDDLSQVPEERIVAPARDIIHDVMVPMNHPLLGVSPIFASGLAAVQGLRIQNNSAHFFGNNSAPGGILTAPGEIDDATAVRLKEHWDSNYSGLNAGKTAVLGDGLKYEVISFNAVDSQLVEQLKMSAQTICSTFHVPPYKIGVGPMPTYQNAQVLNQIYYTDCLQVLIESIEVLLDEGLELPKPYGTEFDIDALLRMDSATLVKSVADSIQAGFMSPNEGRRKFDLAPVPGGEAPLMQQQNWSLEQLARRDIVNDKPSVSPPGATPAAGDAPDPDAEAAEEAAVQATAEALELIRKGLEHAL